MAKNHRPPFMLDRRPQTTTVFGGPWIMRPAFSEDRDGPSISLEIQHDFSGDPDQFVRVAMWDGERWIIEKDDDFDARVRAIEEHEDVGRHEAVEKLEQANVMAYRQCPGLLNSEQYDEMIAYWKALNLIVSFAISDRYQAFVR